MADLAKRRGRVMGHPVRFLGKTLYVPWRLKDHGWKEGKSCTLGCVHSLLPCDWRRRHLRCCQ